jgi:nucleoside-diphosphate-sugar epimerase
MVPNDDSFVLVTGGTGYLASWVLTGLLERGHHVRTTVRDLARARRVRDAVAERADPARLSFVQADLTADHGWDAAMEGVGHVLHVASPLVTDRSQDLVRTAREGTRRVLDAAHRAGVRRVVLTSSAATALPDRDGMVADETVWANPPDEPAHRYARSKTLAERDAWDFVATTGTTLELVTILPSLIQGPTLGQDGGGSSVEMVRRLLAGRMPGLPNIGWSIVDVRDLVDLHIRAMTAPEAAGERFLAAGEFRWMHEIAALLRDRLGNRAAKVPTRRLPDFLVRLAARGNPLMAQLRASLGRRELIDASKADKVLGWRTRPVEETLLDTAGSLLPPGTPGI